MKGVISNVATVALSLAAILIAVQSFSASNGAVRPADRNSFRPAVVLEWNDYIVDRNSRGPAKAPVTIIEFSDFQCPACAETSRLMADVTSRHEGVAHVYRHLPLTAMHPEAAIAARASECAAEQGMFRQMHDELYESQSEIGVATWDDFGSRAGIKDRDSFSACVSSDRLDHRVTEDAAAARRLGATGTPTLLVNEMLIRGVPDREYLDSLIAFVQSTSGGSALTDEGRKDPSEGR